MIAAETVPTLIETATFALAGIVISALLWQRLARFAVPANAASQSPPPPDRTAVELGGVAILGMFAFAIVGQAVLGSAKDEDSGSHVHRALLITIVGHAAITAIAIALARRRGRGALYAVGVPYRSHLQDPVHGIAMLVATVPAFLSISGLNAWIVERLGATPHQELVNSLIENRGLLDDAVIVLGIGVVGPLFEEILFRGMLLRALREVMPAPAAIASSALIFALHHDPQSALPVFLLGCVFGLAYVRTQSIVAPFVAHALFNMLQLFFVIRSEG